MSRSGTRSQSSRSRRRKNSTFNSRFFAKIAKALVIVFFLVFALVLLFTLSEPLALILSAIRDWFLTRFGLAIVIPLAAAGALAWIFRHHGERSLLRRWNRTLGATAWAFALFVLLGILRPEWAVGEVDFAAVTLGGQIGESLAGDGFFGGIFRLALLTVGGAVAMWPRGSAQVGAAGAVQAKRVSSRLPAAAAGMKSVIEGPLSGRFGAERREADESVTQAAFRPDDFEPEPAIEYEDDLAIEGEVIDDALPVTTVGKAAAPPAEDAEAGLIRSTPDRLWKLPGPSLLDLSDEVAFSEADNQRRARLLEQTLKNFDVSARVIKINQGPAVTQFGLEPGWDIKYREVRERDADGKPKIDKEGNPVVRREEVSRTRVKVNRITALANDIALALAAPTIRIEAPVPGKAMIGVEVPNRTTTIVSLRSVVESGNFQKLSAKSKLALALGQSVEGDSIVADLAKMPHLLIAGATGSGKSVCINSIIACLLMHADPTEVRFLMVDPKRVELSSFGNIPHLLAPIVVDTDKVVGALRWVTKEMDERYQKFAHASARNIDAYNARPPDGRKLPYIVVIIDELADVMMAAPFEVERTICRLAQLARAAGIHLVIATQRPSVDVVTGLIKANFPTRIAFAVTSQVDSRTILDGAGAEKLLGRGDMLYMATDAAKPRRIQGVYLSDVEIDRLVRFWINQEPEGLDLQQFGEEIEELADSGDSAGSKGDSLYAQAREIAEEKGNISTSYLQRRLRIGYNRAARLVEQLEEEGVLEPSEDGRTRQVRPQQGPAEPPDFEDYTKPLI